MSWLLRLRSCLEHVLEQLQRGICDWLVGWGGAQEPQDQHESALLPKPGRNKL